MAGRYGDEWGLRLSCLKYDTACNIALVVRMQSVDLDLGMGYSQQVLLLSNPLPPADPNSKGSQTI